MSYSGYYALHVPFGKYGQRIQNEVGMTENNLRQKAGSEFFGNF